VDAFVTDWLPWIAHLLLLACCLFGMVGSAIPAVPGTVVILVGSLLHGLLTGWAPLGFWTQALLLVAVVGAQALQYAVSAMGAKKYGASKWGVGGAMLGMILGIFIPIPVVGPFVGAFAGALIAEWAVMEKESKEAAKAGFGAVLGAVAGLMAELGVAIGMVSWILMRFVVG
jgi:uncharacterized protein